MPQNATLWHTSTYHPAHGCLLACSAAPRCPPGAAGFELAVPRTCSSIVAPSAAAAAVAAPA